MGSFFYGLSNIFPRLIDHSVEISLLICLIFIVKLLAPKRLPSWWHYCLWVLLLVRMIAPFEFENRLNLFNFVPEVQTPFVSGFIGEVPVDPQVTAQPAQWKLPPKEPMLQIVARKSLPVVWLTGAMILGICIIFETVSFWLSVRRRPVVTDEAVLDLLSECKSRMRIRRKITIIVTDNVRSPALFGYLRPRLLLPEGVFEKLDEKELAYAFMHELGHLKRHDIGVSWLVTVLQVVHWFNPLVWLAFYQLRIDQESACDAAVLARMKPKQSAEYAQAIVGFLEKFCQNCQLPSLAGVLENRTQMKRRISRIVRYRKTSHALALVSVVLLSSTALALFSLTGVAAHNAEHNGFVSGIEEGRPALPEGVENPMTASYPASQGAVAATGGVTVLSPVDLGAPAIVSEPAGAAAVATAVEVASAPVASLSAPEAVADAAPSLLPERMPVAGGKVASPEFAGKPQQAVGAGDVPVEKAVAGIVAASRGGDKAKMPVGTEATGVSAVVADHVAVAGSPEASMGPSSQRRVMAAAEPSGPAGGAAGRSEAVTAEPVPVEKAAPRQAAAVALADNSPITAGSAYGISDYAPAKAALPAGPDKSGPAEPFQAIEVDVPPSVVKSYPPRYPYLAKRDDISGSVVLQFVVTKDGNAVGTTVVKSQPEGVFDETALQAIEQYRFKPGVKDGKAVDVKVHLPIKFTLS